MKDHIDCIVDIVGCERREAAHAFRQCYGYMDLSIRWLKAESAEEADRIEQMAELKAHEEADWV